MGYDYTDALLVKEGGLATITLNRPEKLNAFTPKMSADLREALREANEDDTIRCVILTGEGRAFSAGADVNAWDARLQSGEVQTSVTRWRSNEDRHELPTSIYELKKPTIAAVKGPAIGMGMDFALACDMRIVAESAKFGMLYIRRGLVPDEGGAWFLPRIVGYAKAAELIFSGNFVLGPEAAQIGLANTCVPDADLMTHTRELADRIANGPPIAMEFSKRALRRSENISLGDHFESIGYHMSVINDSEDVAEGMRAFVERREPIFKGR